MKQRKIEPVKNNLDKQRTYAKQKEKYKSAMQHGFYLEAMMIDYALLEDRLRSVLYHIGFLPNRKTTTVWKKARPYFTEIVKQYKTEKENGRKFEALAVDLIKLMGSVLPYEVIREREFAPIKITTRPDAVEVVFREVKIK